MLNWRELLIGPPLPTGDAHHQRLSNVRALAALSPDALASVAYANQEIFLGLVVAGSVGLNFTVGIAMVIAGLLAVLTISYSQTITAYPGGGGSYTVARENLGPLPGMIAAAALMTDYVLNAAVSVTAGVTALAAAFPVLWDWRVPLALGLLVIITIANLRGLREAGTAMVLPVFLFLGVYFLMIGVGIYRAIIDGPAAFPVAAMQPYVPTEQLTLLLILHTFATGCTALTGVEALSNGTTVFRPPEAKNANKTMLAMSLLMAVLFIGTTGLTQYLGIVAGPTDTILSALARRVFGGGPVGGFLYYAVQIATLLVLMVAANTSFMDFPRVSSILARDGYMPRQLAMLGDRLVYSNAIVFLAAVAGVLTIIFQGDPHLLIPLFAVGAFLAFTLSQAGMVMHWWRERGGGWQIKLLINGLGTLSTLIALLIIGVSKFLAGAWIVLLIIPLLVFVFNAIRQHYAEVREQLTLRGLPPDLKAMLKPRVVLPVAGVHRGTIAALRYALSITDQVTGVYVEIEPGSGEQIKTRWKEWGLDHDSRLVIIPSPYRSVVGPFLDYLDKYDEEINDGQLASVLLPEFIPANWWETLLHNQMAWAIQLALMYGRRRIGKIRAIIDVPMYLRDL
jgi:amino acid transporter